MTMRIAVAQILSGTDPAANLQTVADATRRAAGAGARLVVFPEATMCRLGVPLAPVAEPLNGRWADGVRAIAADAGVTVFVGMFTPGPDGRVFNTVLATGGGVEAGYDKIHLYDAFGFTESQTVAAGNRVVVVSVDGIGVGITTCYDVRFPYLYTELADLGAQLITVSASWGAGPGKLEQWTLLTRARALDSGCYVAAAGQGYPGPELAAAAPTGVGGSLVSSPVGEVLISAGAEPQILMSDLDLDGLPAIRDAVGVLRNRMPDGRAGKAESPR